MSEVLVPEAALHQSEAAKSVYCRCKFRKGVTSPTRLNTKAHKTMTIPNDVAGTAALTICESILLALNEHNILPEKEIVGILKDSATAHENCPPGDSKAHHAAVAKLINGIIAGGNSVRHT